MTTFVSMLTGFVYLTWQELKYLTVHKIRSSYLIFILIFGMSIYGIAIQKYSGQPIQNVDIIEGLKVGDAPLIDILIFMIIFGMTAFESAASGVIPDIIIPADLGITLIIIISILLGINMVSRLAVRSAASSISREIEAKTFYLTATTPNTRPAIYLAKFTGSFLTTLPMVAIMVIGVYWISSSVFTSPDMAGLQPELQDLIIDMVLMILSTVILFTALGTLVSISKKNEESAVNLAGKFITLAGALTTLWILLPIFGIAGEKISSSIETLTMISPITLDMIVLYKNNETLLVQYAGIQLLIAAVLIILGIIVFIRQDIEY